MLFAKNLRHFMQERGLTVAKLSRKSGIPAKTLYHWLSGQKPRHIEQIFAVSDALGVGVDALFGRLSVPPSGRSEDLPPLSDLLEELRVGSFELILRPVKRAASKNPRFSRSRENLPSSENLFNRP